MSRHRKISTRWGSHHRSVWKAITALLSSIALVVGMSLVAPAASADDGTGNGAGQSQNEQGNDDDTGGSSNKPDGTGQGSDSDENQSGGESGSDNESGSNDEASESEDGDPQEDGSTDGDDEDNDTDGDEDSDQGDSDKAGSDTDSTDDETADDDDSDNDAEEGGSADEGDEEDQNDAPTLTITVGHQWIDATQGDPATVYLGSDDQYESADASAPSDGDSEDPDVISAEFTEDQQVQLYQAGLTAAPGRYYYDPEVTCTAADGSAITVDGDGTGVSPWTFPMPDTDTHCLITNTDPNQTADIVVHMGGDRDGTSSVKALPQDAHLKAVEVGNISNVLTCTSDANGKCTFEDAAVGEQYDISWDTSGSNNGAPSGWFANTNLAYAPDGNHGQKAPFKFRTNEIQSGTNNVPGSDADDFYESQYHFAQDNSGTKYKDNVFPGLWPASRDNPPAPEQCGELNIALVMDVSGSMKHEGKLGHMQSAANNIVKALIGKDNTTTPKTSTEIALYKFAKNANKLTGLTNDAYVLHSGINGLSANGTTNWDQGLYQVVHDRGNDIYDIVVVLTDGDPTTTHNGSDPNGGSYTDFNKISQGIFSANAIKAMSNNHGGNTRLVAIGIGLGGTSSLNLAAISGQNNDLANPDYYSASSNDFADDLYETLLSDCGYLEVTKKVVGPDGNTTGAQGWHIYAKVGNHTFDDQTDGQGNVVFSPLKETSKVQFTVTEDQQPGYTVKTTDDAFMECTQDNAPLSVTNTGTADGKPGVKFKADPSDGKIHCTIVNQPTWLTLTKKWGDAHNNDAVTLTVDNTTADDDNSRDHMFSHEGSSTADGSTDGKDASSAYVNVAPSDTVQLGETYDDLDDADNYDTTWKQCSYTDKNDENKNVSVEDGEVAIPKDIKLGSTIHCVVENTLKSVEISVNKVWKIDGKTYNINGADDGNAPSDLPDDFSAQLTINGTDKEWATDYDDYYATETIDIGEDFKVPEGCVVEKKGLGDKTLGASSTNFVVNNIVHCPVKVELEKEWGDHAKVGDAVGLSIQNPDGDTGVSNVTGGNSSVTSSGTSGSSATADVMQGSTMKLTESFDGSNGSGNASDYSTTLQCKVGDGKWQDADGLTATDDGHSGTFEIPDDADRNGDPAVLCRFTNTMKSGRVTLDKTWKNGKVGDGVDLIVTDISSETNSDDSGSSSIDESGEVTTTESSIDNVYAGDKIKIEESASSQTDLDNYTTTWQCMIDGTDWSESGNGTEGEFTVPGSFTDGTIACAFDNVRKSATLKLHKEWVHGLSGDSAKITVSDETTDESKDITSTVGEDSHDTVKLTVYAGDSLSASEVAAPNDETGNDTVLAKYTSTLKCTVNGKTLTFGPFAPPVESVSTVVPSVINAESIDGQTIHCTLTNTRKSATLTLEKNWVNPIPGDKVDLTLRNDTTDETDEGYSEIGDDGNVSNSESASITIYAGDTNVSGKETAGNDQTNLENYDTAWKCTIGDSEWFVSGEGTSGSLEEDTELGAVPSSLPDGAEITCIITNTLKPTTVTLSKAWVNAPDGASVDVTVTDGDDSDTETWKVGDAEATKASLSTVHAGDTVDLSEEPTDDGTDLSDYTATWQCTYGEGKTIDVASDGSFTVPAGAVGKTIDCTVTNTYIVSGPQCTVNDGQALYALTADGQMKIIDPGNGTIANFGKSADDVSEFNGLGIGSNGSSVYAFSRSGKHRNVELYEYNTSMGKWSSTGQTVKTKDHQDNDRKVVFVTGAVASNGDYYFGGFSKEKNETRFYLWKYDGSNISKVGYVEISNSTANTNNGDIAFDSNGDLFIVHNTDTSTSTVFSVTASNVAAASSGQIPATKLGSPTTIKNVNGIAFGGSGSIYLGSNTAVHSYSLPGFSDKGSVLGLGSGSMSDLASCGSSPNTLTVVKDLPNGRASSGDQFTLTVKQHGESEASYTATTEGSDSGVQSQVVGPLLVSSGDEFTISEDGTEETNLGAYGTSLTCSVGETTLDVTPSEESDHTWTVSMLESGGSVTCTVTNTYNPPFVPPNNPTPTLVAPLAGAQCTLADDGSDLITATTTSLDGITYTIDGNGTDSVTVHASADSGYELNNLPDNWTGDGDEASITYTPDNGTVICVGGESSSTTPTPTTSTSPSGNEAVSPATSSAGAEAVSPSSSTSTEISVKAKHKQVAYTGVPAYRMGFIALMLLLIGGAFITLASIKRRHPRKH